MIAKPCCGSCNWLGPLDDNYNFGKLMSNKKTFYLCDNNANIDRIRVIDYCEKYQPRNPIETTHEKMWNYLKKSLDNFKPENENVENERTGLLLLLSEIEKHFKI